jgi:hypothetical protein
MTYSNKEITKQIDLDLAEVTSAIHKIKMLLQAYKPESVFLEKFLMAAEDIEATARSVRGQLLQLWEEEKINER